MKRTWTKCSARIESQSFSRMNFRPDKHTILDVGLNLGLNDAAPKAQVYTGISLRF
jgi:hypothetical protein